MWLSDEENRTGSSKHLSKQQCSLIAVKPCSIQDLFVIHSEQKFQRKLYFNPAIISVSLIMKNIEEEVIKDFDDIFKYIGGWGPFQVKI